MSKGKMILLDVILGILVAVLIVGNGLALSFSGLISIYLNQETWTTEQVGEVDPEELQYYKSEYATARELRAAQEAFARDLQAESTVLLQNSGDTLPLAKGAAVTLLGAGSAMDQFMLGGIGSGAIDTSSLTMTLQGAFEAAGYSVNQTMVDFYAVGAGSSYRRASATGSINEAPVSLFGADEVASFAQYNDAGIVVIGREAGEGQDILFTTTDNPEKHMLQLSDEELELIRYSCDTFDKTVVLINTTMAMQLGELSSLDLACLYIGGGGMSGFEAIPEILNGTRYPSGHLADTYVTIRCPLRPSPIMRRLNWQNLRAIPLPLPIPPMCCIRRAFTSVTATMRPGMKTSCSAKATPAITTTRKRCSICSATASRIRSSNIPVSPPGKRATTSSLS